MFKLILRSSFFKESTTCLSEADIPEDRPISAEVLYDVKSLNKKKKKKKKTYGR